MLNHWLSLLPVGRQSSDRPEREWKSIISSKFKIIQEEVTNAKVTKEGSKEKLIGRTQTRFPACKSTMEYEMIAENTLEISGRTAREGF